MTDPTSSKPSSAELQLEPTPPYSKSNIDSTSTWRLIGTHALGFLTLVLLQWIVSFYLPESPMIGGLTICASYFTLLSVWLAFGNSGERAWAIPLAFACFAAQSILIFFLEKSANIEFIVLFAIVVVINSLALFLPMIALQRITRARIERMSQFGGLYSERFNFGIGELIFATAVVAIALALAKFVVSEWGLLPVLAVVPLCSLFHVVLVTPDRDFDPF